MHNAVLHGFAHRLVKKFDLSAPAVAVSLSLSLSFSLRGLLPRSPPGAIFSLFIPGLLLAFNPALGSDFIAANGAHPIRGVFGFPVSYQHAGLSTDRKSTWLLSLQVDHSNIFAGGSFPGENLILDGETTRLTVAVNAAITRCSSLGVELPFVWHRPGFLDRVIDRWHDVFSLPNARRDLSPRDRLVYFYGAGLTDLQIISSVADLGDIQLQAAYDLQCVGNLGMGYLPVARVGVKLPTGDPDRFTGSGEADLFFDLVFPSIELPQNLSLGLRAGFLFPGESDLFPNLSSNVFMGAGALAWRPDFLAKFGVSLHTQLDIQGRLFDSQLRELGAVAGQLGTGLQWQSVTGNQRFEFAFMEDIVIDTAPDVVVHLRYEFGW